MPRPAPRSAAPTRAQAIGAQRRLITLAVDRRASRGDASVLLALLVGVNGVEAVAPDPASVRVWVFGNGALEPEGLVDALASWGFESTVLEDQLTHAV